MAQITVISGVERRRRWSDDQKLALVEAAIVPGASVAAIARDADVTPSSIYRWRRQLCGGAPKRPKGFTAVAICPDPVGGGDVVREMMVIELGGATVRVPNTASPALLVAALGELRR
jgi:transposase